jgi:hypothetical protein
MSTTPTNVSIDGSPVQIQMDSPLLACFDPLVLDMFGFGPHFALVVSDSRVGMQFDGDGIYAIPAGSVKLAFG